MIDNLSKFGWTVPLYIKNARTIKDCFKNILISSKRSPNLIETDRGKKFFTKIVTDFLNKKLIKLYSRNICLGAVFNEKFNCTIRDIHKRPVFLIGDANSIDVLPTKTKRYNKRTNFHTKVTLIEASLEKN